LNKKTVKLVSKIADQEIPKEIQDRIDSREKTIKLVATILKWVKKLLKSGLEKREHDTVQNPFEDLRKLIQRLNIDRSPKLLEIRIKI